MNIRKIKHISLLILGVLVVGTVVAAIETSTYGAMLNNKEAELAQLEAENRELVSKYVEATSLSRVAEVSKGMGMVKASDILYLDLVDAVAKLP